MAAINLSPFRLLSEFDWGGGGAFIALIFDSPQGEVAHFPYVGVKIVEAEKIVDGDNGPEKQPAPELVVGPVGERFAWAQETPEFSQRHEEKVGGRTVLDWGGVTWSGEGATRTLGGGDQSVIIELKNIEEHFETAAFKLIVEIRYGYASGFGPPDTNVNLVARLWHEGVYSWRAWGEDGPQDPVGDPPTTFRLPSKDPDAEESESFTASTLNASQSAIPEGTVAGWGGGQHVLTLVYDNIDADRLITLAAP